MICPMCKDGIGLIDRMINGKMVQETCSYCEGIGEVCDKCEKNPVDCGCYAGDKTTEIPVS
jgi:hypothetical protein